MYCSMDAAHLSIYYAVIAPNAQPDIKRPFISEYVGKDTTSTRNNAKEFFTDRGDRRDRYDAIDHGCMDMFDGGKDGENHRESI